MTFLKYKGYKWFKGALKLITYYLLHKKGRYRHTSRCERFYIRIIDRSHEKQIVVLYHHL